MVINSFFFVLFVKRETGRKNQLNELTYDNNKPYKNGNGAQ